LPRGYYGPFGDASRRGDVIAMWRVHAAKAVHAVVYKAREWECRPHDTVKADIINENHRGTTCFSFFLFLDDPRGSREAMGSRSGDVGVLLFRIRLTDTNARMFPVQVPGAISDTIAISDALSW
jgi:hypothetical protein